MPTRMGYSGLQIALHWIIAALIVANWLGAEAMEEAYDALRDQGPGVMPSALHPHQVIGIVVLVLAMVRLVVRLRRGVPAHPAGDPPLFTGLASVTHWAMYALIIVIPVTGILAWGLRIDGAAEFHGPLVNVLVAVVILHLGGAIRQEARKGGYIRRITRPQ
jgi:cytochrome b561